jgi:hypothetical protein
MSHNSRHYNFDAAITSNEMVITKECHNVSVLGTIQSYRAHFEDIITMPSLSGKQQACESFYEEHTEQSNGKGWALNNKEMCTNDYANLSLLELFKNCVLLFRDYLISSSR